MFWKRKDGNAGEERLPGPKGIHELVGRYMVTEMNKSPDWVWRLSAVRRDIGKKEFYCRVFDEAAAAQANVLVKNWTSLDNHPELVLFEGYVNKEQMLVRQEKFAEPSTASS